MLSLSMIQPWLILGAIVLILILALRMIGKSSLFSLLKNNFFYFFLFIFLTLFIVSAINIHSTHSFDFSTLDGWKGLFKVYFGWFSQVLGNLAKITGYVAQQDWIIRKNSTG